MTRNLAGEVDAPGCGKTLSVGDWSHTVIGPVPIDVFVPDGGSFQFSFTSFNEKTKWSGPSEFFEPFLLEAFPLSSRILRKTTRESASTPSQAFTSVEGTPPLSLKHFVVGADELRLEFSGKAMVQENGRYAVNFDLLQFARRNTLMAGLLAMLDAALLGWIGRVAFGSTQSSANPKGPKRLRKQKQRTAPRDRQSS